MHYKAGPEGRQLLAPASDAEIPPAAAAPPPLPPLPMHTRTLLLDLAAGAFALAGLVGLAVACARLDDYDGDVLAPQFVSIYLTTYMLVFGLQIAWLVHLAPPRPRLAATLLLVYYVVVTVIAFILMAGYYAGLRPEGGSWALFLIPCTAVCAYLAARRLHAARDRAAVSADFEKGAAVADLAGDEITGLDNGGWLFVAPQTRAARIALLVGAGLNALVLAIALLTIGLLMGGALSQAQGYRAYPPRGQFVTITSGRGRAHRVMVWCTGERSTTRPTVVFDLGGGGHSSSDSYGLQFALNDAGYRVCTYDYPGTGWSDYGVGGDVNQPMILDKLLEALAEPPPYVLLGQYDGGAERIYDYALRYPANVRALLPVDYAPGPPEFETYRIVRNYTDAQARDYAVLETTGRYALGNLIRGAAVQWGLISVFTPPSGKYIPAELATEQLFLNVRNEKQWHTQVLVLKYWLDHPDELFRYSRWTTDPSLAATVPVFWFYNDANITRVCTERKLSAADCAEQQAIKDVQLPFIRAAANLTAGSQLLVFNDADTYLGQGNSFDWMLERVLAILASL